MSFSTCAVQLSANPSTNVQISPESEAAWQTIKDALDALFDLPEEALHYSVPVKVSYMEFMQIYTAAYNWASSFVDAESTQSCAIHELFPLLDSYFSSLCTSLYVYLAAFSSDMDSNASAIVSAYACLYNNYTARFQYMHSLFKSPERMWKQDREGLARNALVAWDLPSDAVEGDEAWASAIVRAEAGRDPQETPVVSTKALLLRKWRIHLLEPLTATLSSSSIDGVQNRQAADVLLGSLKEVGLRKDDERRIQIEDALVHYNMQDVGNSDLQEFGKDNASVWRLPVRNMPTTNTSLTSSPRISSLSSSPFEHTPSMGVLHDKWDNMDPLAQYALIGIAVLIVIHLIGLRMLVSPQQYKEDVTLRAAHRAFLEDADSLPEELVEYTWRTKWTRLLNFYSMKLHRNVPKRFEELRKVWGIDEDEYRREVLGKWHSFGSVGLSGSMFFRSEGSGFLLKSLGRQFENHFLHEHFLRAYFDHARLHPQSYINKLTDVLYSFDRRLGETLKASPSHYIVIENIAFDKKDDWEMYDLKPPTYLEPFRDLLPERVQMSGVTDILPKDVKVFVSREERERMLEQFRIDTEFLARLGAVDYSVLLIRLPDGSARWALIDIFWSLREPRAKLTKYASDTVRLPQQTVTADADGYAQEVLAMIREAVVVREVWEEHQRIRSDVVLVDI